MLTNYLGLWPAFVFAWALAMTTGTTSAQTTSTTFPTNIEFDLVFPRNETYAADALLPIVIAIQNPQEVGLLGFSIAWYIYWRGVNASNNYLDSGYQRSLWANYSTVGNEPYFETFYTNALNGTEGQFTLVIDLGTRNCSFVDSNIDSSLHFGQVSTYGTVDFEMRNGAQLPSLITPKDLCPVGFASFGITKTIPQSTNEYMRDTCPVMADAAPKMNPCAVKINSTVASNISAGVVASACGAGLLISDCQDDETNMAAHSGLGSMGWSGVVAGLVLGAAL
ncbi:hypothetical protein V494_00592 [Pseudogymnoascus sp. VKM F-4513 (FW-928)]|nr:hypothetical protein V494_00592 [Pseudogymnoascus sp. VKM F-4513 (FW-928)]